MWFSGWPIGPHGWEFNDASWKVGKKEGRCREARWTPMNKPPCLTSKWPTDVLTSVSANQRAGTGEFETRIEETRRPSILGTNYKHLDCPVHAWLLAARDSEFFKALTIRATLVAISEQKVWKIWWIILSEFKLIRSLNWTPLFQNLIIIVFKRFWIIYDSCHSGCYFETKFFETVKSNLGPFKQDVFFSKIGANVSASKIPWILDRSTIQ